MSERPFAAVNADDLASCVACGLCLPHCPTYRTSGDDAHSPRGRIALIAGVRDGILDLDRGVTEALDTCVQCMGCLPACPSGVRYDRIIAPAIDELTERRRTKRLRRTITLFPLGKPSLLRFLTFLAAISQRLGLAPRRLGLPRLPLRTTARRPSSIALEPTKEPVILFSGCVMDAWYGDVHRATYEVLTSMGYSVTFSDPALCCGALHTHAGLSAAAARFDRRVRSELSGATIVVNSAGCGAHLRDVFSVDGTAHAKVVDVMEFIDENIERLVTVCKTASGTTRERVVVHDACHLRNIQGTHLSTHRVLAHFFDPVPIPDEGLCCGAGGAFALEQPAVARGIVERKYEAVRSVVDSSARFLSSGNPGCLGHMTANKPSDLARLELVHPVQLVARMLATEE